ncbi:MAG: protein phosphatase 2C domain-containing protein [Opitutales bacterium]|nr:protein phosphatase 2C domain-containing protein [Opitutales bacterium]
MNPVDNWRVECACVQGAAHVRTGAPCQDAVHGQAFAWKADRRWILAVADGHGSKPRADEGAQFAVEAFVDLLKESGLERGDEAVDGLDPADESRFEGFEDFRGRFARRLLARWRELLEAAPARASEAESESQPASDAEVETWKRWKAFGTTLTGALILPDEVFLGRIGDSDAFLVYEPSGAGPLIVENPFADADADSGLIGLETHSLSSREAHLHWRTARRSMEGYPDQRRLVALVLATDGFADSFADPEKVVRAMIQDTRRRGSAWLAVQLRAGLERFTNEGSGDDIGMVVLFREEPGPAEVVAGEVLETNEDAGGGEAAT